MHMRAVPHLLKRRGRESAKAGWQRNGAAAITSMPSPQRAALLVIDSARLR
jgi:hypothetical protein